MSVLQKRLRPAGTGRGCRKSISFGKPNASSHRLPAHWRDRLCLPLDFYRQHIPGLREPDEAWMVTGQCPLCADRGGTFKAHVANPRGPWCCSAACGYGDLIGFAQRLMGADFTTAVRALIEART